jgi:hypothetical protein
MTVKDLTVILEDKPGTLAEMGEALGKVGINIEGLCGFPSEGKGVLHLLIEDTTAASRALKEAGLEVRGEREVLVLDIEDRPGAFGEISRRIARAGVNIDLCYVASNNRLVLGTDDPDKAHAAV